MKELSHETLISVLHWVGQIHTTLFSQLSLLHVITVNVDVDTDTVIPISRPNRFFGQGRIYYLH